MKINKLLIAVIILFVSFPIFIWLESGFAIKTPIDLIKPVIFSISLAASFGNFYKRILLTISLILLSFMVVFYLLWKIDLSNWFGSLGLGVLAIYIFGYLPQLIKKGFVEKI